jgi:hypothetical protein
MNSCDLKLAATGVIGFLHGSRLEYPGAPQEVAFVFQTGLSLVLHATGTSEYTAVRCSDQLLLPHIGLRDKYLSGHLLLPHSQLPWSPRWQSKKRILRMFQAVLYQQGIESLIRRYIE